MMSNKTIDITPSWETAAMIYCEVLQNPDSLPVSIEDAKADLIRLGQYVDRLQAERVARESNDD